MSRTSQSRSPVLAGDEPGPPEAVAAAELANLAERRHQRGCLRAAEKNGKLAKGAPRRGTRMLPPLLLAILCTLALATSHHSQAHALKFPAFFAWMQTGAPNQQVSPSLSSAASPSQPMDSQAVEPMMASGSSLFDSSRLAPPSSMGQTAAPVTASSSGASLRKPFQSMLMLPGKHQHQIHLFSALPKSLFGRLLASSSSSSSSSSPSPPLAGVSSFMMSPLVGSQWVAPNAANQQQQQQKPALIYSAGEPTDQHHHFQHLQYQQQVPKVSHQQAFQFRPPHPFATTMQQQQQQGEKHALGFGESLSDFVLLNHQAAQQTSNHLGGSPSGFGLNSGNDGDGNDADGNQQVPASSESPAGQEQAVASELVKNNASLAMDGAKNSTLGVDAAATTTTNSPVTTPLPLLTTSAADAANSSATTTMASNADWSVANATSAAQSVAPEAGSGPSGSQQQQVDQAFNSSSSSTRRPAGIAQDTASDSLESSAAAIIVAPGEPSEGPQGELTSDEQVESFILGPYRGHHNQHHHHQQAVAPSLPEANMLAPADGGQFGRELHRELQQLMAAASGHQAHRLPVMQHAPLPPASPAATAARRPLQQAAAATAPARLASSLLQQAKSLIHLPFVHSLATSQGGPGNNGQAQLAPVEPMRGQSSVAFVSHQAQQQQPPPRQVDQQTVNNNNNYPRLNYNGHLFNPQQQHQHQQPSKQSYFLMAPQLVQQQQQQQQQPPHHFHSRPQNVPYFLENQQQLRQPASSFQLLLDHGRPLPATNQYQPYQPQATASESQRGAQQLAPPARPPHQQQIQQTNKFKSGLYQIEPPKLTPAGRPQQQQPPQEFQQVRLFQAPELGDGEPGESDELQQQLQQPRDQRKPATTAATTAAAGTGGSASDEQEQEQEQQVEQQQVGDEQPQQQQVATTQRPPVAEFARQVGASMGVATVATLAPNATQTKVGQVFNEPVEPSGQSRGLSELKSLRLSQDITLYDFEGSLPSNSPQQQHQQHQQQHQQSRPPVGGLLDTQVYTIPYMLQQPQQPMAAQRPHPHPLPRQHHHHQHFRHQHYQPQAQASYLHQQQQPQQPQQQLGRFPLQYAPPPPPQPIQQQPQLAVSMRQQQPLRPQPQVAATGSLADQDFRSPFRALYQEFAGGPQVGGAGQLDWAPAQALGLQPYDESRQLNNQNNNHYFHYQPLQASRPQQLGASLAPPSAIAPLPASQQQQQVQPSAVPTSYSELAQPILAPQQHQFVLAIQHQEQPGGHLFSSSATSSLVPQQQQQQTQEQPSLSSFTSAAASTTEATQAAQFVEALTSAAPPADESTTVAATTMASVQELSAQEVTGGGRIPVESSQVGNDDDGFSTQDLSSPGSQTRQAAANSNNGEQSASSFCAGRPAGLYADESQRCRAYYQCAPTGHQMFRCNNQTQFNQKTQNCDWWYNVDCSSQNAQQAASFDDTTTAATTTSQASLSSSSLDGQMQTQQADQQQPQQAASTSSSSSLGDLAPEERKQLRHWSLPSDRQQQTGGDELQASDLLDSQLGNNNATTPTSSSPSDQQQQQQQLGEQAAAPTSATPTYDSSAAESHSTTQEAPVAGADSTSTTSTTTAASTTLAAAAPEEDQSVLAAQSSSSSSSGNQQQQISSTTPTRNQQQQQPDDPRPQERRVVQSEFGVGVQQQQQQRVDLASKAARSAAARYELMRSALMGAGEQLTGGSRAQVAPNEEQKPRKYERRFGDRLIKTNQ